MKDDDDRRRDSQGDDLTAVMREEVHRSRRGVVDTRAQCRRREMRRCVEALLDGPLEAYEVAIAALTHGEQGATYRELIQLWYEKQRGRRRP